MTPVSLTSSRPSNTKLAPLDHAKQLAATLLSERSEASGALVARQLHEVLGALDAGNRRGFQRYLATEFQPDGASLRAAAERYLADGTAEAAAALARAADPPRQELLRRINMAPGGIGALITMRSEIGSFLRDEPELKLLDADLQHLFASWFNRGFLELRRIDWQTPAAVLEKLIAYEAVHEIKGWDDLRRRLAPDRRCFAFFHPALPGEPLIFLEVALVEGLATAVPPLLSQDTDEAGARARAARADTAIFYSISNCQDGLRGVSFGNLLIKQVVEELNAELPQLERFSTLSPVPGFRRWLTQHREEGGGPDAGSLPDIESDDWCHDPARREVLRPVLMRLCALYLTQQPSTRIDPVARFHLGNGARLERINWLGNNSPRGIRESFGIMVNYLYDRGTIEDNHKAFVRGTIVRSQQVDAILKDVAADEVNLRPNSV
ncbi:MAG: Malonyl-CoA decarboxylase [Microvirga sp.]|nr:Malonyl-CoA decarboxylase [Microvirga sp.]